MNAGAKSSQLQIRVSAVEKAAIQRAARRAGMTVSSYVLSRLLNSPAQRFQELTEACLDEGSARFALAELNSLLDSQGGDEMREAVATPPPAGLSPYHGNYIAAMVEYACARRGIRPPVWTQTIAPLAEPVFASSLESLRLHLLTHSPPPFRRRGIFIDASVGSRV
jgi:uncharacterized protein (DUF1778 family)